MKILKLSSLNSSIRLGIILSGAVFFFAFGAWADTMEIVATDNAYVLRSQGDQTDTEVLQTKRLNDSNTRVAYVRFDLTSFLTTHAISGITSAKLRLYQTSAIADTERVYGLDSVIGGTNEFDDVWTSVMSFATQPAGNLANSSTALPNNTTTAVLGSVATTAAAGEVDITLSLADFQNFLTTNGNAKITLLFHNTGNNILSFASTSNTGGNLQPTLELVAPVLVSGTVTWSGATSADWDTNTLNWTTSGSPTNFLQGNSVQFDDMLVAHNTVNLTMPLFPGTMTVSNFATDYTFNGSGSLSGKLLKQGTGKLIIDNSGVNSFSTLTISNGILQVGNNDGNGTLGAATVTNNGSLIFRRTNSIIFNNDIVGTGNVSQNGSGTLTLSGTIAHTGSTIVNSGTLVADALTGVGVLTNAAGSTLAVAGTNAGAVNINGTLAPGNIGTAGTFGAGSGVTLGSAAVLSFDVGSTNTEGSGVNDSLIINGNFAENGTLKAIPTLGAPLLGVPYTLAEFSSASGSFSGTSGGHYSATFNQTTTNLTVTFSGSGANLKWNSAASSAWDAGVTTNWLNGASLDYFYQGDSVTFDDTATQTTVALSGAMSPTLLTVNSTANNYTVGGSKISGAASIVKSGSSTLTLNNANDFTGTVSVNAGILKIGNNSALGSTNAGTTIASGATLDVNSKNLGQEPVTVSGSGTDGNGVIINNLGSATTFSNVNLSRITFTGNTTIGGSARLDLRSPATGDPSQASLTMQGGNAFNLTKKGVNQLAIVGMTVDTNLADIDVQNGILSVESATTGLGNPASNLTVENGAVLGFFNMTNFLNKNIILNGNGLVGAFGTINNFAGNNTIVGPMTLNGDVQINFRTAAGGLVGGSLTLSNAISGTGSLTKNDTNTLVLAGYDTYSGNTAINDGTFILNSINTSSTLTENTSQSASAIPVVFGGSGTNLGPVDIEDVLHPGITGHPSTLTIGNGPGNDYPGTDGTLMFGAVNNGIPSAVFDLGSTTNAGGGINDLVVVNGDLDGNLAHIKINPLGALNTNGVYTLVTYTGAKNGNFNGTVNLLSGISRYTFALNYPANAVTLSIGGGPVLLQWNNAANSGSWDVQSSQNWFNTSSSANDTFYNQDSVLLDDSITNSATPTTSINLTTTVLPTFFTNNSTTNYLISGTGKISGSTGLTKSGSSTLTLLTTNDFTGNTLISGGMVAVQNNNSLGATNGIVYITNGATLNISSNLVGNGLNFGAKLFVISGSGIGGNGVIINNWTNQQNAFQNVVMAGDATIGGSARFDLRGGSPGPVLDLGGHTLTKTGNNQVSMVGVIVTNTGGIIINGGVISFETTSIVSNSTVTINSGGALGHFRLSAGAFTDPITLNGGTITNLAGGGATNDGPITLTANSTILHASGNDLYLNGVISQLGGSFGLTKLGSGNTILTANETYTGNTTIGAGTLTLRGASLASSNITVAAGATLDATGRGDLTLTLNNGQTIAGSGNINGKMTNNVGATLSPGGKGAIGNLTVSSAVVLNGTTYVEATNSATQVDKLTCGSVFFGGALVVSNLDLANPFTTNTALQLFSAGTYSGAFSSITPANPNGDPLLAWDTNTLAVNGTLKIVSTVTGPGVFTQKPRMTTVSFSGNNIVANVTNAQAGDAYYLLTTTNLNSPWKVISTNVPSSVGANGSFTFTGTNAVDGAGQQQFYILVSTNSINGIP